MREDFVRNAEAREASEWYQQWSMFQDDEKFLFEEWIAPFKLSDFKGKTVLECGCGGGQHTALVAPLASHVTAIDLYTAPIAMERNKTAQNVTFLQADLTTLSLGTTFDVVMCIGVIHHTDDPDRAFEAMYRHCRPGGTVIIWTYSEEGNALMRYFVDPIRRRCLRRLARKTIRRISMALTLLLYIPVYTVYLVPFLSSLPYYSYFRNFRRLCFERNVLNVFDKLNAPQTFFTTAKKCREWFNDARFEPGSISMRHYAGVSYSLVGVKRSE